MFVTIELDRHGSAGHHAPVRVHRADLAQLEVLADSFVLAGWAPGEFWIASYFSPGAEIRARLEGCIIADDVAIEDAAADWAAVALLGGDPPPADPSRRHRGGPWTA